MSNNRPFSPEKLLRIRRMRKARRLHKKVPLFALTLMQSEYEGYTEADFTDDLRRRTKKKVKKVKSPLVRYGRYRRMIQLITLFRQSGNYTFLQKAGQLKQRMTKPYRILVRLEGKQVEYSFSPLIPIERIEELTNQFNQCKTLEEARAIEDAFNATAHLQ